MRIHIGKAHKPAINPTQFVIGTCCPICVTQFWDPARLSGLFNSPLRPSPDELEERPMDRKNVTKANRWRGLSDCFAQVAAVRVASPPFRFAVKTPEPGPRVTPSLEILPQAPAPPPAFERCPAQPFD